MRFVFYLILLSIQFKTIAQEMVQNGGAEQPLWVGWTQATAGEQWWPGNASSGTRDPHSGTYLFFPQGSPAVTTELYQDINVTSNSVLIDAGIANYTFSGWRRGYRNVSPYSGDLDRSQIILEYRDVSGNVLESYDTGSAAFTTWTNNTDTRNAPIGTRHIRIRLISTRVTNTDNDGYYDDISLILNTPCISPTSIQLTPNTITSTYCLGNNLTISGIVSPANANYYYTWYKNGSAITTPSKTYSDYTKAITTATDAGTYTLRVEDGNTETATCYLEKSIAITINAPVLAGTISSNSETCANTIPAPFTGTASTGGTTAKYYKWQRSTGSASGPWIDVQVFNTTATGYTPTTPVVLLEYYRRIDSSGTCSNVATNTISILTKGKYPLAPITSLVRDTLCVGESFQLTPHMSGSSIPYSFNGGYYFTWKKVQSATTTIIVPTSPSMSLYPTITRPATLADSGTYYMISQDGPTATQCKDSVKIVIHINQAPTKKALIQNHQELCLNTRASLLTESSAASGSFGDYKGYQWYSTLDTTGIPTLNKLSISATNSSYDPGTPTTTNYFVRKDSIKYCAAVATNFLKVRVNNTPILDSIRATVNDTLCENFGDQFQLKGYIDSLTAGKQSINGGFYFTWKKLQEPASIPVTISAAGPYKDYPAISRPVVEADSGTYYLYVQDGIDAKECLDFMSIKIVVSKTCISTACYPPDFVSIKVSSASNTYLCKGGILILQKDIITFPTTPPTNGYSYSWERTNSLGTVIIQGPSTVYQDLYINPVALSDSGSYKLIVKDGTPTICSKSSASIYVTITAPITAAQVGTDTIICVGEAVLPFTETITNTGGTGTYIYQWKSSTDNNTFINIVAATNRSYQSPNLLTTTYFKRIDQSGACMPESSNTITALVSTGVDPGSIASANTTVCYNTIPSLAFTNTNTASDGTAGIGSETYQWQKSLDGSNWININGANGLNYSETTPLTNTTFYRRKVGMGPGYCDTAYTLPIKINVFPPITAGNIGNDTLICSGSKVKLIEILPATGNISIYRWVESLNNGITWSAVPGNSNTINFTSSTLTDTIWYKRVALSTCTNDSSNIVRIDVIRQPIVSAGNDFITQKNTTVTLQGNVSGTTNYVWTPSIGLSNQNSLNPNTTIINTITYTLEAWDATNTCNAQSSVTITVNAPIKIPNVITPNGDGVNDTWIIDQIGDFPNATFTIYNRWGNIVWKANGKTFEWNGTNFRNGEQLPDGTYFYIIDLKSISYSEPFTGYVQLIR